METSTNQNCQSTPPGVETGWYCIRSKPKHEHIAAANLKRLDDLEVFNPRFRSRKATRRGPAWVTESLFPNYLFVRFPFQTMLDPIRYTEGVSSVVRFGDSYPEIPADVIEELRQAFAGSDLPIADGMPRAGDAITITTRAMFGLQGVVLRSLPARQRVQVLLDLLGQTTMVELGLNDLKVESRSVTHGLAAKPMADAVK